MSLFVSNLPWIFYSCYTNNHFTSVGCLHYIKYMGVAILIGVQCRQKCLFGCTWLIKSRLIERGARVHAVLVIGNKSKCSQLFQASVEQTNHPVVLLFKGHFLGMILLLPYVTGWGVDHRHAIAKTTSIPLFSAPQHFPTKSACSDHALIMLTTPMRNQSAKRRHMHVPAKPISKSRDVFSQSISDM